MNSKPEKKRLHLPDHGVPPLYAEASLLGLSEEVEARALSVVAEGRDCLLQGIPGAGKTYLATAMMVRTLKRAHSEDEYGTVAPCWWVMVPKLLKDIKGCFGTRSGTAQATRKCYEAKVLVLDDLGAEKESDWSATELYVLIADRINNCKQTIITTNLSGQAIKEWNARLYSRLSGFERIIPGDVDRRKEG